MPVTSRVTVWLGLPVRRTVNVSVPPASVVTVEPPLSTTIIPPSSSVTVSVASGGAFTSPLAVPDTVMLLSGASVALSTAVTVTVPVLVVEPDAIVSVVALDSMKSPDAAGGAAAADTVTVVAALAVLSRVAVTVETPPFSETDDGDNESVAFGSAVTGTHLALTYCVLLPPPIVKMMTTPSLSIIACVSAIVVGWLLSVSFVQSALPGWLARLLLWVTVLLAHAQTSIRCGT